MSTAVETLVSVSVSLMQRVNCSQGGIMQDHSMDRAQYLHKINEGIETAIPTIHLHLALTTHDAIVINTSLDGNREGAVALEVNAVAH